MSNFSVKLKNGRNPDGKPRVYFTCHPADFDQTFEKLCEDIFKTHDCAIYYTEDMTAPIEDAEFDLDRINLFVIPVTLKLLLEPNRAMDSDFAFAMKKHIPVMPVMFAPGLDPIYSRPDKFGKLQYIDPFNTDRSAISYEEKLKKHLDAILLNDETIERVRKAFDAYIFLSYRKMDRSYANKMNHLNSFCFNP